MAGKMVRKPLQGRGTAKALLEFTHTILGRVQNGTREADLLRDAAILVLHLIQCQAVEIWVNHGSTFQRFRVKRGRPGEYLALPDASSWLARACQQAALGEPCPEASGGGRAPMEGYSREGMPALDGEDGLDPAWRAIQVHPLEGAVGGALVLADPEAGAFTSTEIPAFAEVARILGLGITLQRPKEDLGERVKELTCLFGLSRLLQQQDLPLHELLQGVARLIPPAWQYPDHAFSRISFDDEVCASEGFRETSLCQRVAIRVRGEVRGGIEVFYRDGISCLDAKEPFLPEERNLLEGLGQEVALAIERRQLEKDRERLLEQIRHMDRLATVGQFASGIAHELNEPLCSILGLAQLAIKDQELSPQARGDLRKIVESSLHARDIVKGFLTFSRVEKAMKAPLVVNQLIEGVLDLFAARCARERITVRRQLAPGLPEIQAVPSQMRQVLVNLIINGIQAMPKGGTLTLETRPQKDSIRILVDDTGIGMDGQTIQKIFTPFFTTKDAEHGTGLGLGIVQDIIVSHGGKLSVESRRNAGSRFIVELPAVAAGGSGDRQNG